MVPGFRLLPEGAATDQVTAVLAVPLIVAVNWTVPPLGTAGLRVTAIAATASLAVTVVLAFSVTLPVSVPAVVHQLYELNGLLPEAEGAVSVTELLAL
jgi:hypothetical protein